MLERELMDKKNIIMVGPFPPPFGGVSIHTSRLTRMLRKEEYEIEEVNTSNNKVLQSLVLLKLLLTSKLTSKRPIVHNHGFRVKSNALIIWLCRVLNIPYIQTIHSFRLDNRQLSKVEKQLIKYSIKNSSRTIVVSEQIKRDLVNYDSLESKMTVIPAFIPYNEEESNMTGGNYIDALGIREFIDSHDFLLCANASKIAFYNNDDLYGIDLCIDLVKNLKDTTDYNLGFIFMLPTIYNREYYSKMQQRIKEYNIENNFIFINKEVDMVPLFKYVDIFIRPTNTDGDALSVRESLFSGVPCIASDASVRPEGTTIFKNRDIKDLINKVTYVIENISDEKDKAAKLGRLQDFTKEYSRLYKESSR